MQHFLHRWNDEQKEVKMQDAPFAKNYEPEMASGIAMKQGATYMDNRAMIRAKQNQNKLEKKSTEKITWEKQISQITRNIKDNGS